MKIVFHGVGGAFAPQEQYNSGAFIQDEHELKDSDVFLIDVGTDARHSLAEEGVTVDQVKGVFITHLHADHVGGLEWLAFATYFNPKAGKPTLYVMEDLLEQLLEMTQPGLGSIKEIHATLYTYFDIVVVKRATSFVWRDLILTPLPNIHVYDNEVLVPSYGLSIYNNETGLKTLYSGDTMMFSNLVLAYEDHDIIYHDCETLPFRSGVHTHYEDLRELPDEIREKMYLYHYADNGAFSPREDGFGGFLPKGQKFDV